MRNILAGACGWPKTLFDFAVVDARLAAISAYPIRQAII